MNAEGPGDCHHFVDVRDSVHGVLLLVPTRFTPRRGCRDGPLTAETERLPSDPQPGQPAVVWHGHGARYRVRAQRPLDQHTAGSMEVSYAVQDWQRVPAAVFGLRAAGRE